ncbi:MAG TPA: carboxymuconolactone decarboxylase family protein [Candidatus Marinimicrobia bacterium]|nr:hypothetical protein [Candidatus Neomarinimicrobiota bacterium]MDP6260431.1 carboxymuconolactone decarboxylase family protein [Candidatus Neomarinimicrobiota bacterium]MDP7126310.1 carboxymuconolactone decarboxylase family protein [Candidatus Neomarinimicrobiota bacterium]MDP7337428.1 carboxymuconolactone decarboxylase family protein [Candidatus Neomarinimicrobiota bacterium]MDP7475858.1 carboxymuconolactone decarboxylase family protein [Candidatus Neomarinimicrobiota bacterium]
MNKIKSNLIAFLVILMAVPTFINAQQISEEKYKALVEKNPFNAVYPKMLVEAADNYFGESMKLFSDSAVPEKEAHLAALAASVVIKCQYCIPYHKSELNRLGASDEEVKVAVQIAAEVMRMSTLFYGNEFDLEAFKASLAAPVKETK